LSSNDSHSDQDDDGARPRVNPAWGDTSDLLALLDVTCVDSNRYLGPPHGKVTRNVVEGGQLLGQAIAAASKELPDQYVVAAHMLFPRAARFDAPTQINLDVLRRGRTFSTVEAHIAQAEGLCGAGLLLLGTEAPDEFRLSPEMPTVPPPSECDPLEMGVTGRELRVVDGAWSDDPDEIGPPEISVWVRFRDDPREVYLRQAVMAQSASHWLGAAAMRPLPGVGLAQAHLTLMGDPLSISMAFHDEVDVTDWLLYSNVATYAGRGTTHGESRIFTQEGRLAGSFTVTGMMRRFPTPDGSAMQEDLSRRM
jgi:acyl-CoA thioesterase